MKNYKFLGLINKTKQNTQTISMKELLIVFFILTVFIMAMAFPFKTRLMFHTNLLKTKGFYSFKIMKIKLLTGRFYIDKGDGFTVENSANLLTQNYNKPFVKNLMKELTKKVDIKKVEMYFTGGFKEDSYSSAIMCGFVSSAIQTIYSYIYEKFDDVKLYEDVEVTFNEDNIDFTFDIVIKISLIAILKSIFKANKLTKQGELKWRNILVEIELKRLWQNR